MSNTSTKKQKVSSIGIFVWILATIFFFYEYFLRVFLGTIADDVMRDLFLSAEQFSIITASYYVAYGIMQTPVGILVDRYGSRLLLTLACIACALGVIWFSFSNGFYAGVFSRLLIGFGSAFAFVSLLSLSLNWFPKDNFGFMVGLAQLLGAIGPIVAGAPLAMVIKMFDGNWRLVMFLTGILGIILTLCLALFIRNKPKGHKNQIFFLSKSEPLLQKIQKLLNNPQIWFITFYAATVYVSLPLLGAYWGVSYIESRGFSKSVAAFIVSMLWLGLSIGCPTIGKVSDKIKRRKPLLIIASLLGILASSLILFFPTNNDIMLAVFFLLLGLAASGQSLSFATISEHAPTKLKATSLGVNNTTIMLLGAIIPQFASSIIQRSAGDNTSFVQQNFESGLIIMPILFSTSFLLALFTIKETFCRPQQEIKYVSTKKTKSFYVQ